MSLLDDLDAEADAKFECDDADAKFEWDECGVDQSLSEYDSSTVEVSDTSVWMLT